MLPISLCMIVKNEKNNLDKCLKSIVSYVDEIIIVDTGSTDNTKEIAYNFTDKVYDFVWVDDFSKARNFSISKANNDWILVLDADEFLINFDELKVQDFISNNEKCIGRIERIEFITQNRHAEEVQKSSERISRLFNKKYYLYEGRIHEQVMPMDGTISKTEFVNISVDHMGYISEEVRGKNKWERNKKLLEKSIEEKPNDPYLYYHLGKVHYLAKNYSDAIKMCKKTMGFDIDYNLEYVQDMIITYGYSFLSLQKYEEALIILKYEPYFRNFADYYFLLGLIKMNMSDFSEAINCFVKCKGKTEKIVGTSSYLPNYNIGVIYEVLGNYAEALRYYGKCDEYTPTSKRINEMLKNNSIKNYIQKLIENGDLVKAKDLLSIIEKFIKNDPEIYSLKAVLLIMENNLEEAKMTIKKGLEVSPNDRDLIYNLDYIDEIAKEGDQ